MRRIGEVLREVWRRPRGAFGLVVVALVLLVAAVSLVWLPHPLLQSNPAERWSGPSLSHPLGQDGIGRDTLTWLMVGTQATVKVVVGSTVVAALVGLPLGAATALLHARVAEPLIVVVDILIAFPTLLLAMVLAAPFGGSLGTVILAVGFASGITISRITRPEIRKVAKADYLLASRAAGAGAVRRLVGHILPNVAPIALVQLSIVAAVSILAEAGLTYLGYGAPNGMPSWGRSLSDSQASLQVAPLAVVWPGLAIGLTVLALNLLGDALREATDPRLRRTRQPAAGVITGVA
ncbi:MAG: ABC transporter permease [Bifidobacteriaceae bacterium]|jgi:peptide/nickel transport system permease protein|nr:ABC transporter permease [Bifidobacteriaceae bacterium]